MRLFLGMAARARCCLRTKVTVVRLRSNGDGPSLDGARILAYHSPISGQHRPREQIPVASSLVSPKYIRDPSRSISPTWASRERAAFLCRMCPLPRTRFSRRAHHGRDLSMWFRFQDARPTIPTSHWPAQRAMTGTSRSGRSAENQPPA